MVTLSFGHLQNQGHLVGGDISLPKTLWLNLTILSFLVLPAVLWRDDRFDQGTRAVFGAIFASFLVRAVIELPIIYLTDWWRCSYGIAHDLITSAVVVALFGRVRARGGGRDGQAAGFLFLFVTLLFVEAAFARAFCSVADPAAGIYFAGDEATFRAINRATWAAVIGGYSALVLLLWRTRSSSR